MIVFTLPGTADFFVSIGLPSWLAYVVFAGEAVAGSMLVLGIQARWAALASVPILLGATWVHSGNGWVFDAEGGGWEYPLLLAVLMIVLLLLGEGAWAVKRSRLPRLLRGPAPARV